MTDEWVLHDSEYVRVDLLKNRAYEMRAKFDLLFDEIPGSLRATEQQVRGARGADDPAWLTKHLRWRGCVVAKPYGFPMWVRCPNTPTETGYCKSHRMVRERRAAAD
jgi:hypothetical protein